MVRIYSKDFYDQNGNEGFNSQAIGTGPFKFVSWKRNDRLVLEANEDWYFGSPKIKNLVFRIIPEMGARVAELQAGGVDIISAVPPFMTARLDKGKDSHSVSVPSLRAMFMIIDTTSVPELKDKRLRQALNYAVDKQGIIKGLLNGMGIPLGTQVPIPVGDIFQSIKPYPYNPEKARALLKEAGYHEGLSLDLYSPNGRYAMDKEIVLAVAEQLSNVGIKANVHIMETNSYMTGLVRHSFKGIYYIGMNAGDWDVSYPLGLLQPQFVLAFHHIEAIQEMIKNTKVIFDKTRRFEEGYKVLNIIHDEAPYIFLHNEVLIYGLSNKVSGFEALPNGKMHLWNASIVK